MKMSHISFFVTVFCLLSQSAIAADTISPNQRLQDGGVTLVSSGEDYELGFFSPPNSSDRYVGIWFRKIPVQTVFWVANRNNPLTDRSGVLTITASGNIVIFGNQTGNAIWSSNSLDHSPVLQLLNTGNLVVRQEDSESESFAWQSFDHPCDTLISGMKLGWSLRSGLEWYLTSWKSPLDPSAGDYTYRLDPDGLPQLILHRGSVLLYRSGPWDGVRFGGGLTLQEVPVIRPEYVYNSTDSFYSFRNYDNNTITRFVVDPSGALKQLMWSHIRGEWVDIINLQGDQCDTYALCGPNGICDITKPFICQCPTGFTPGNPKDWASLDYSSGCIENVPRNCRAEDGFKKISGLKLPDRSQFLVNTTVVSIIECAHACLSNCSCSAYTVTEINSCVVWYGDLLDLRECNKGGQDLYLRLPASALGMYLLYEAFKHYYKESCNN